MATSGIDRIQFNPAARPVDTVGIDTSFQRMAAPVNTAEQIQAPTPPTPPQRPQDTTGDAKALIAALSTFGGVAKAFLDERDDNKKQADIVSGGIAAMNRTEASWADAVRADPNLASESPWFRKAFTESIVKTSVSKRVGELQAEYATSDIANSTDPGAIQAWFTERMKDTLSKYTDQDSRAAALEVARDAAAKFAAAHTKNATGNLILQADKAGAQGFSETLDAHGASTGTVPAKAGGPVALASATPAQRAFLKATASGESPAYNIRYGGVGSAGKNFDINGAHPAVMELTKDGDRSSAAGRYQITFTTWKDVWNGANPVMTPENQDRAALTLAQQRYAAVTVDAKNPRGRNLWEDIDRFGFNSTIQNKLAPTWVSFRHGQDRRSALFNQELRTSGGQIAEHPQADPEYDAAQVKLYADRDRLVASGQSQERVNTNLVQSVLNKALETLDPTYLKMLDHTDGNGLKLSAQPEVQQKILTAQNHINSLTVTRDNLKRMLEERQKQATLERVRSAAFIEMERGYKSGNPKPFTSDQMIEAAKLDVSLAEKMEAMNKNLLDRNKQEDQGMLSAEQLKLYSGQTQLADVPDLIASGVLRDPSTIKTFFEQARHNQTHSYLDSSVYRTAVGDLSSIFIDPNNFDMEKARKRVEAIGEMRRSFDQFMTENPKASPQQQADFLDGAIRAVASRRLDIDEWKVKPQQKPAQEAPQSNPQDTQGRTRHVRPGDPGSPAEHASGPLADHRRPEDLRLRSIKGAGAGLQRLEERSQQPKPLR